MDPRPYHFQYRRPRFSNPTQYLPTIIAAVHLFGDRLMSQPYTRLYEPLNRTTDIPSHIYQKEMSNGANWHHESDMGSRGSHGSQRDKPKAVTQEQMAGFTDKTFLHYGAGGRYAANPEIGINRMHKAQSFSEMNDNSAKIEATLLTDRPKPPTPKQTRRSMEARSQSMMLRENAKIQNKRAADQSFELPSQSSRNSQKAPQGQISHIASIANNNLRMSLGQDPKATSEHIRVQERQDRHFNIINCGPKSYRATRMFPKLTLEDKIWENNPN